MARTMQIPIREFDFFTSDGTYVGVKFRYRLKEDSTDNNVSQWSEIKELVFKNTSNQNITLSEANGYDKPVVIYRPTPFTGIVWETGFTDKKMMPSQIDQIISQNNLTPGFTPNPKNDLYRLSWITPENFNIGKFDIFQSWRSVAYVHPTADISSPSSSGANFIGTLSLTGTNASLRGQTLKSYYDWFTTNAPSSSLELYATEGTVELGNTLSVTGYSGISTFSIRSADTWVSSGNVTNISRINAFSVPEYFGTTDANSIEFSKRIQSNKVSATLVSGSSIIRLNQDVATSGIVPGMTLTKISGDGRFSSEYLPIISQIDYQNNLLFIGYSVPISGVASEVNVAVPSATVSSVSSSAGVWTALVGSSSIGSNFEVGYMISATPGSPGSFGDGLVRVSEVISPTQIKIQSNKAITAGTVTNIATIRRNNHPQSGYIEFVGDASNAFQISYGGITNNVIQHWLTPVFCQSIIAAPTKNKDWSNPYTTLSVSELQTVYGSGLGEITLRTTSAPFTARITGMSMPYSSSSANSGFRMYANQVSGGGSIGSGEVKIARYISGNSMDIVSTAVITNGFVYGIRL